jgi:predicted PurR-regulated permease PerM
MAPSDDRFYPRLFAVLALGLLGLALLRIFTPFALPILWSALLALLLDPLNQWLRRRLHGRTALAAGLLTAAAAMLIAAPAAILVIVFTGQLSALIAKFEGVTNRYQISGPADVFQLPPIRAALQWLEGHLPVASADIEAWILEGGKNLLKSMAASGGTILMGMVGALVALLLTLFLLFFFLRDGREISKRLIGAMPIRADHKDLLGHQLVSVTKAVVLGTLITATLQGTLVGVGFAIVGFPSAVVFGALAAGASLLPIGGTAFIWGPGAIVLGAQGRWTAAILLAVYGVVIVGMVDNFLKPLFISGKAQISTLPVFFGVMGGLVAFGPIGMFLGPVVIALALAILKFAEEAGKIPEIVPKEKA